MSPARWRAALRAAFCAQLAALDVAIRGAAHYASNARSISFLLASAALLYLATGIRRRSLRLLTAVALALMIVLQGAFYLYYHAPVDDQVALAAARSWADVRPVAWRLAPKLFAALAAVALIEHLWLRASADKLHRKNALVAAASFAVFAALGGPWREATLDLRMARAALTLATLRKPAPASSGRPSLPPLLSTRRRLPNVLFLITESVRASDDCVGEQGCILSPETTAALPDHVVLEMRSVASYTAISMSALLTGLAQVGPRAPILAAPDLFDFARAARQNDGAELSIHYWSSQSPSFFERSDVATFVDSYVSADTLLGRVVEDDGDAIMGGLDRSVARACEERFSALESPYLAVVHFVGTHAPYFFDDPSPRYVPYDRTIGFSTMKGVHNAYLDAIAEQDRSVARCVRAFLDAQRGAPFFVLFTSDHGESFGERGAIHHGQNLYDEQIRVPAFAAWGNGALTTEEVARLEGAAKRPATHLDVLPTLLDALGIWNHFAARRWRAAMLGESLLAPPRDDPPALPITNCSEMWQCTLNAWGMLRGRRKIFSQPWDGRWRCMDLSSGEREVGLEECSDLVVASHEYFPVLPNGLPNR